MRALPLILPFVLVLPAMAQESKALDDCMKGALTQAAMNRGAAEEAKRAGAELDTRSRALVKLLSNNKNALAKYERSEQAWQAYRDAFIEARFPADNKQAEYGTVYPTELALVRARLTRARAADLDQLIEANKAR